MSVQTEPLFSSSDVMKLTGATYKQLDYWTRIGLLRPMWPMGGSGTRRHFRARDVCVARALVAAPDPKAVNLYRLIADALYEAGDVSDATLLVVFADGRAELLDEDELDLTEPCWIYPLGVES
jgi:hypothetical protein